MHMQQRATPARDRARLGSSRPYVIICFMLGYTTEGIMRPISSRQLLIFVNASKYLSVLYALQRHTRVSAPFSSLTVSEAKKARLEASSRP